MIRPLCPVCRQPLDCGERVWRCGNGHCYDVARQGYVNLLPVSQKHALHPGDTRDQVAARRRFLDAGFYAPLQQEILKLLGAYLPSQPAILDIGCGEGYYSAAMAETFGAELWGVDVSKDAVRYAAGRSRRAHWITASAAHLPFPDGSFDAVTALFSLTLAPEFHRVLRPGGLFLQVLAGPSHLLGLKQLIYPQLLKRDKHIAAVPGFSLLERQQVSFAFHLENNQQILDLLAMTPHYWRITKSGAEAAAAATTLDDRLQAELLLYRADPSPAEKENPDYAPEAETAGK